MNPVLCYEFYGVNKRTIGSLINVTQRLFIYRKFVGRNALIKVRNAYLFLGKYFFRHQIVTDVTLQNVKKHCFLRQAFFQNSPKYERGQIAYWARSCMGGTNLPRQLVVHIGFGPGWAHWAGRAHL